MRKLFASHVLVTFFSVIFSCLQHTHAGAFQFTGRLRSLSRAKLKQPTRLSSAWLWMEEPYRGSVAGKPSIRSALRIANAHIVPALVRRLSDAFAIFATLGISLSLRIPQTLMARFLRAETHALAGGREGNGMPSPEVSSVRFSDVLGIDEAKAELEEVVAYLKNPAKFTRLGGKLPKGILLTGAPGTGKTLLAKAVAGEAGVPFFYKSGSEFDEMFVGVGSRRLRELFRFAKMQSPCIIFIDELETIGASRELSARRGAHHESLNQLLVELDGFAPNNGTIVIAATNYPTSLDSALTRPGRFDKKVHLPFPDAEGRKAILELYGKKLLLAADADLDQLARNTNGLTGADLSNILNQAALKAATDNSAEVSQKDIM